MRNKQPPAMGRIPAWVLAVVAGFLLAVAGEGPDFGHYTDWAAAALSGDMFQLRGNVLSPGGVPFSLAAAGPGLLFAVGKAVLLPLTLGSAALVSGWIASLVFWGSALIVLRRVADGDEWLALLGAGALFVGTHAGLYSHSYATEAFANALIAVLWAFALTRDRWRPLDSAVVGALAGLLLLVRAHVVLYAVPALWMAVFGDLSPFAILGGPEGPPLRSEGPPLRSNDTVPTRRDDPSGSFTITTSPRRSMAARLAAIAVPMAIAAAEYAMVNQWMTGSPLHPPYVYGGAGFSSVDLSHPELAAVLIHPWHGLLSYHPLYGVAFVAVAIQSFRGGRERALWSVTLLAAIAHIWVQGGWYIWWLGGSTFGMRGMAPAALPLVAALVSRVRRELDISPGRASLWVWTIALACVWSYPLLLAGNTQFLSWGALLAAQEPALAAIGALVVAFAYRLATRKDVSAAEVDDECRIATFGLLFAIVAHLAGLFVVIPSPAIRAVKGAVGAAFVALIVRSLSQASPGIPVNPSRSVKEILRLTLAAAVLTLFAAQAVLFGRLAVRTERYLASGASPPRWFEYESASPVDELRVTYAEYREVSGFAQQKAAFRRFLTWQRIEASRLSPSDRQIADTTRQRLLDDPLFGDLLVEATARNGGVVITGNGMSEAQQSRARELALGVTGAVSVSVSSN